MSDWCDFGDLPTQQCACPKCRPDVSEYAEVPIRRREVAVFENSPLACGHAPKVGDPIALTDQGDWICGWCAQ